MREAQPLTILEKTSSPPYHTYLFGLLLAKGLLWIWSYCIQTFAINVPLLRGSDWMRFVQRGSYGSYLLSENVEPAWGEIKTGWADHRWALLTFVKKSQELDSRLESKITELLGGVRFFLFLTNFPIYYTISPYISLKYSSDLKSSMCYWIIFSFPLTEWKEEHQVPELG